MSAQSISSLVREVRSRIRSERVRWLCTDSQARVAEAPEAGAMQRVVIASRCSMKKCRVEGARFRVDEERWVRT